MHVISKKLTGSFLLVSLLSACAAPETLAPDFEVAADLPAEIALAWLEQQPRVEPPRQHGGLAAIRPPCIYQSFAIQRNDGKKITTHAFSNWEVTYAKLYRIEENERTHWVLGTIQLHSADDSSLTRFSDTGAGCYAYYVNKPVSSVGAAQAIETARVDISKTLSALASLRVVVKPELYEKNNPDPAHR